MTPTRYRSDDEDSGWWAELPLRAGDIVISTRCALLFFRRPDLLHG